MEKTKMTKVELFKRINIVLIVIASFCFIIGMMLSVNHYKEKRRDPRNILIEIVEKSETHNEYTYFINQKFRITNNTEADGFVYLNAKIEILESGQPLCSMNASFNFSDQNPLDTKESEIIDMELEISKGDKAAESFLKFVAADPGKITLKYTITNITVLEGGKHNNYYGEWVVEPKKSSPDKGTKEESKQSAEVSSQSEPQTSSEPTKEIPIEESQTIEVSKETSKEESKPQKEISVVSVSISNLPTKTTYEVGETLDASGLKLKVSYSDGTSKIIEASGFAGNSTKLTKTGTQTINIKYEGKTVSFIVNVIEITSIQIESFPTKTTYNVGEYLDASGLKIKVIYSDGSSKIIDASSFVVGSTKLTKSGTQRFEIQYEGQKTEFQVEIKASSYSQIKNVAPDATYEIHSLYQYQKVAPWGWSDDPEDAVYIDDTGCDLTDGKHAEDPGFYTDPAWVAMNSLHPEFMDEKPCYLIFKLKEATDVGRILVSVGNIGNSGISAVAAITVQGSNDGMNWGKEILGGYVNGIPLPGTEGNYKVVLNERCSYVKINFYSQKTMATAFEAVEAGSRNADWISALGEQYVGSIRSPWMFFDEVEIYNDAWRQ